MEEGGGSRFGIAEEIAPAVLFLASGTSFSHSLPSRY